MISRADNAESEELEDELEGELEDEDEEMGTPIDRRTANQSLHQLI